MIRLPALFLTLVFLPSLSFANEWDVEVVTLEKQHTITVTETLEVNEANAATVYADFFSGAYGDLKMFADYFNVSITGMPFARFPKIEGSEVTVEAGFPVSQER